MQFLQLLHVAVPAGVGRARLEGRVSVGGRHEDGGGEGVSATTILQSPAALLPCLC